MLYLQKDIVPSFLSQFDVWHHGIVNLQQAEDLLTGIVRKPMLRWTPGVFITPGTYHIPENKDLEACFLENKPLELKKDRKFCFP